MDFGSALSACGPGEQGLAFVLVSLGSVPIRVPSHMHPSPHCHLPHSEHRPLVPIRRSSSACCPREPGPGPWGSRAFTSLLAPSSQRPDQFFLMMSSASHPLPWICFSRICLSWSPPASAKGLPRGSLRKSAALNSWHELATPCREETSDNVEPFSELLLLLLFCHFLGHSRGLWRFPG